MSLINDREWLIRHLRIEFLRSEDQVGERIITFKSGLQQSELELLEATNGNGTQTPATAKLSYLVDDYIPEKSLCYSPNIPNATSEVTHKIHKNRAAFQKQQTHNRLKQLDSSVSADTTNSTTANAGGGGEGGGGNTASQSTANGGGKRVSRHSELPVLQFRKIPLLRNSSVISNNANGPPDPNGTDVAQKGRPRGISTLSVMIQSNSLSDNPFSAEYSHINGKAEQSPIRLQVFFPHSKKPTTALDMVVRRDATVEEVIGYSLYVYVEEKRLPDFAGNKDLCLSSAWNLRIVEDDGEIDDDFPALERSRKIQKFSFDSFAVVMANPDQAKTNESDKLVSKASKSNINEGGSNVAKKKGGNIFVKVHLYSTLEVKQTTTVALTGDMLLSEVLVVCCKKRKIDPNDYTLKMADTKTDIPLDRTLESLGIMELCLLKKDRGPSAGDIFLRPPEEMQDDVEYEIPAQISDEYTSVYKKYTVTRKMPLIMGKAERVLAIDGDYIYIMPPEQKNLFDSVKTVSYHASSVISCKQSKKLGSVFKLVCQRERDIKSMDFEASSPQEAREICTKIHFMSQFTRMQK